MTRPLLTALLIAITISLATAVSAKETNAPARESLRKLTEYLTGIDNTKGLTAAQWKKSPEETQGAYIFGVYMGHTIASYIVNRDDATLEKRQARQYLLDGWTQRPSDYVTKVTSELNKTPVLTKSLAAAIVRSEAAFARAADTPEDTERAQRLSEAACSIEYQSYRNDGGTYLIGGPPDKQDFWQGVNDSGCGIIYLQGILDGIAIERATIVYQLSYDDITSLYSPPVHEAMNTLDTNELQIKSARLLYLYAEYSLVKNPETK